jgi:hypothetical protein
MFLSSTVVYQQEKINLLLCMTDGDVNLSLLYGMTVNLKYLLQFLATLCELRYIIELIILSMMQYMLLSFKLSAKFKKIGALHLVCILK